MKLRTIQLKLSIYILSQTIFIIKLIGLYVIHPYETYLFSFVQKLYHLVRYVAVLLIATQKFVETISKFIEFGSNIICEVLFAGFEP
jgi:hypothetical protein